MKRRGLLTLAALALGGAACSALPGGRGQPSYKVSIEQLQQAVARRFPLRYPVAGLVELNVQPPRLRLLPEVNRLGPAMLLLHRGRYGRCYMAAGAAGTRPVPSCSSMLRDHSVLRMPSRSSGS